MNLSPSQRPGAGRVTLDQLVQHNAGRSPDAAALVDAPDRPLWTEGGPRRLTWQQVDCATNAVATRLVELSLAPDSVVAIQGPNSTDTILSVLGCIRAGHVPALLPAGWRKADTSAALLRVGARAIFASTRAGDANPADEMRYVAAENFGIRFICGFGVELPDGVVSFEDCVAEPRMVEAVRPARLGNPAEHLAIITFDCGPQGHFPVARSHNECVAAGLSVVSDAGLERDDVLLTTLSACGFAGMATGLIPWLMTGSTLVLHQAFDATVLGVQIERHSASHLVLPEVALVAAAHDGLFDAPSLRRLVSVVRRMDTLVPSTSIGLPVSRLAAFGEVGIVPLGSSITGPPVLPLGSISAVASADIVETGVTKAGTLALRGGMVPRAGLPADQRGAPYPVDEDGWVATGYPAGIDNGTIAILGSRQDVLSIGGQSMALAAIDSVYADVPGAMAVNAIATPDLVLGERLTLEAVPETGASLSASILAAHAEAKGATPLAISADPSIGDRRKRTRLVGVA